MQMSHAGIQSLFMMMSVHAFKPWCKCHLTEMEMQMSSNGYVMMLMPHCRNAMMQMLWHKHNLFKKNSLCFQIEASSAPETKIFLKLDLLFLKSHPLFNLRLPKKLVIIVRKSSNGVLTWNLMIWLKRFIFSIWLSKGVAHSQSPFF